MVWRLSHPSGHRQRKSQRWNTSGQRSTTQKRAQRPQQGKEARYGIIAYKPEYYGRTCILYTADMEYIGVFECEDTGGERVRTGRVLDVYTGTTLDTCYDWVDEYGTHCYMQWIDAEG